MTVRILFVEDSPDDMELQLRRLRDAGIEPEWQRVQGEAALRAALSGDEWSIALVDYNIPGFSGVEALHLIGELAPDLPAITVSGSIDEETAVATISAGAMDYVLKDNLTRLVPAVQRAMDAAHLKQKHRRAAETARLALFAVDHSSLLIMTITPNGTVIYANDFACEALGLPRESIVRGKIWDVDTGFAESDFPGLWKRVVDETAVQFEHEQRSGRGLVLDMTLNYLGNFGVIIIFGYDLTARRATEASLRESEDRFKRFAERIPGFLSMKDADMHYLFLSGQDKEIDTSDPSLWLEKTPEELWSGSRGKNSRDLSERALAGESVDEVVPWEAPDGLHYLHALYFPIFREGKPWLVGGLQIDITDRVKAEEEVRRTAEQLRRTVEGAVLAMSQAVETRDPYTAGHERRVAELASVIGQELGLAGDDLDGLRLAGLIHDIGKISVPAEILAKPGRLSDVEFNLIKQHSQAGYEILTTIEFTRPVAEMVLQHHERLDGSGYPRGLSADELLYEALILAVADVVEAMSSHRPYRPALGIVAALDEIRAGAGTRYDSGVAAACIKVIEEGGFQFTP